MKKWIITLLIVSLIIRLLLFFQNHEVWWDASVYLGMGRDIYSGGTIGMWEPLRPILWPLAVGFFWKLGLDEIFFGQLIQLILSLGIIYLTYLIARDIRNHNEGLIAASIVAFTPVFVNFNFKLGTEIPTVFLSLLAIYLFKKEKFAKSGFLAGLAFLAKFPAGILIAMQVILSKLRPAKYLIGGFLAAVLPYFIYNYLRYKDIFLPLKQGKYTIQYAGIWIFSQPWHFYLAEFIKQNVFYAFAILGIFLIFKKRTGIIPLTGLALLVYFSLEPHKEPRFMILFFPYFAIMSAYGISKLKIKYLALIVAIISFLLLIPNIEIDKKPSKAVTEYHSFGSDSIPEGEILSASPLIKLAEIAHVKPIYYMVFDSNLSSYWEDYIRANHSSISYILIDTCIGGAFCPPWDSNCQEARDSLLNTSKGLMPKHHYTKENDCEYHVFYSD